MTARSKALRCAGRFTPISSTCPSRSTVTGSVTFPPRRPEAGRSTRLYGLPAGAAGTGGAAPPQLPGEQQAQLSLKDKDKQGSAFPLTPRSQAFDPGAARVAAVMRRSGTFDDSQLWRADPVLHARVSERCRLSPVHLSGIVQGSATSAVSAGPAAEPAPGPPLRWPPGCSFRAVCRGGSRRLSAGTTLVPDDGYRLVFGVPSTSTAGASG